MTHPEELLAAYVDGSLTHEERAEVDAHLATCATCREDIALATRSVALLAELPDERVPVGVMNAVMSEIGRRDNARLRRLRPPRTQWVAGVAAAAAVIALAAVVLPQLGQQAQLGPAAAPNASATTTESGGGQSGAVPLEVQTRANYSPANLQTLALNPSKRETEMDAGVSSPQSFAALSPAAKDATACLERPGGIGSTDRLVRLIQAMFQGKLAYIGMYKEGNPATRIVIWVVSKADCRILSFFSKRL